MKWISCEIHKQNGWLGCSKMQLRFSIRRSMRGSASLLSRLRRWERRSYSARSAACGSLRDQVRDCSTRTIVAVGSNCPAGSQPNITKDAYRISMRAAGQGAFRGRKPRDDTFKFMKPWRRGGRTREASGASRRSRYVGALSAVTRMRRGCEVRPGRRVTSSAALYF